MNQTPFATQHPTVLTTAQKSLVATFMRGVYQWMSLGLLLTAGMAWLTMNSEALFSLLVNVTPQGASPSMLFWVLMIAEIGMVFFLAARVGKMSATAATGLFLAYSLLNGLTISVLVAAYTTASVVSTFFICAGMFGAMSVYGMVTKRDLSGMRSFLMMGFFGILIAMIVNIFLQSSMLQFAISAIGVVVFTGLTAYDTQKLKEMGSVMPQNDSTAVRRGTILGALTLYLDFVNLFIMLLSLIGDRR